MASGAEGVLYQAAITVDGKAVPLAVKMLQPGHLDQLSSWQERWLEHVELLSSSRLPGLVAVREGFVGPLPHPPGRADNTTASLYMVMDWIDGEALDRWVRRQPAKVSPEVLLATLVPVAAALDLLHSGRATRGIPVIHRDVKAANILLTDTGAVLVDVGSVRGLDDNATRRSGVAGTPGYIAPEVRGGGEWSPAADRYGLGAVAWSLLTRVEPPVDADVAQLRRLLLEAIGADRVDIADHVCSMLDPDPTRRPEALANWVAQLRRSSLVMLPDAMSPPLAPVRNPGPRPLRTRLQAPVRRVMRWRIRGVAVVALSVALVSALVVNRGDVEPVGPLVRTGVNLSAAVIQPESGNVYAPGNELPLVGRNGRPEEGHPDAATASSVAIDEARGVVWYAQGRVTPADGVTVTSYTLRSGRPSRTLGVPLPHVQSDPFCGESTGPCPTTLAVDPVSGDLFVGLDNLPYVIRHDPDSGINAHLTLPLAESDYTSAIAVAGNRLIVCNGDNTIVWDLASADPVAQIVGDGCDRITYVRDRDAVVLSRLTRLVPDPSSGRTAPYIVPPTVLDLKSLRSALVYWGATEDDPEPTERSYGLADYDPRNGVLYVPIPSEDRIAVIATDLALRRRVDRALDVETDQLTDIEAVTIATSLLGDIRLGVSNVSAVLWNQRTRSLLAYTQGPADSYTEFPTEVLPAAARHAHQFSEAEVPRSEPFVVPVSSPSFVTRLDRPDVVDGVASAATQAWERAGRPVECPPVTLGTFLEDAVTFPPDGMWSFRSSGRNHPVRAVTAMPGTAMRAEPLQPTSHRLRIIWPRTGIFTDYPARQGFFNHDGSALEDRSIRADRFEVDIATPTCTYRISLGPDGVAQGDGTFQQTGVAYSLDALYEAIDGFRQLRL